VIPSSTPDELEELRASLVHDLRTPLTVITGYAELLLLRDDEQTHREAPAQILEAARRLGAELDALAERFLNGGRSTPLAAAAHVGSARLVKATRKILLVDDDQQLRSLLRLTLPADDFEVFEAADGGEALEVVERERPDLVVLDWRLPVLSGAEVLAELVERPDRPQVIVLTALGAADPTGADALLLKPFSPVELLDLIERLLSGEAPEREPRVRSGRRTP
jgi:CheY-like chemotaxis protein